MSEVKAAYMMNDRYEKYLSPFREPRDLGLEQIEQFRRELEKPLVLIAEEKGSSSLGYATIVCLRGGGKATPYKVLMNERGWISKFIVQPGESIVTIRVEYGRHGLTLDVWENVLSAKQDDLFELRRSAIVANAAAIVLSGKMPKSLRPYARAIAACMNRYSSEACTQIFYGTTPPQQSYIVTKK